VVESRVYNLGLCRVRSCSLGRCCWRLSVFFGGWSGAWRGRVLRRI